MKRFLIGVLLTLTTCISFANSRIADWDKPLHSVKIIDPYVGGLSVFRDGTTGPLIITFYALNDDGQHQWKATVSVRTYTRTGFNRWEWVYMLYDVITESMYPSGTGYLSVAIPSYNQYVWDSSVIPGSGGLWHLADDQYSVVSWTQYN